MLFEVYKVLVACSFITIAIEVYKYVAQGRVIIKKKSSRTNSRTYFLLASVCLTIQTITLIVGALCNMNNWFPVILLVPAMILNMWVFYLTCIYKKRDGKFHFPKIIVLE